MDDGYYDRSKIMQALVDGRAAAPLPGTDGLGRKRDRDLHPNFRTVGERSRRKPFPITSSETPMSDAIAAQSDA